MILLPEARCSSSSRVCEAEADLWPATVRSSLWPLPSCHSSAYINPRAGVIQVTHSFCNFVIVTCTVWRQTVGVLLKQSALVPEPIWSSGGGQTGLSSQGCSAHLLPDVCRSARSTASPAWRPSCPPASDTETCRPLPSRPCSPGTCTRRQEQSV